MDSLDKNVVYRVLSKHPERVRDDTRNPWTPEPRIARLELDDGLDECHTQPW